MDHQNRNPADVPHVDQKSLEAFREFHLNFARHLMLGTWIATDKDKIVSDNDSTRVLKSRRAGFTANPFPYNTDSNDD